MMTHYEYSKKILLHDINPHPGNRRPGCEGILCRHFVMILFMLFLLVVLSLVCALLSFSWRIIFPPLLAPQKHLSNWRYNAVLFYPLDFDILFSVVIIYTNTHEYHHTRCQFSPSFTILNRRFYLNWRSWVARYIVLNKFLHHSIELFVSH